MDTDTYVQMFKMVHKIMAPLVESHANHTMAIKAIFSRICNGFCIRSCGRLMAIVEAIYSNMLSDINRSGYAKANELSLYVWIDMARIIVGWLAGHQDQAADWDFSNHNRLTSVLYNCLMWPLGRTMNEIGVSATG